MVTMPEDKVAAEALVAKLKAGDWINLNTRAFIVEFTAYNANTGLFTVGQIMVEMSRTGVYLPSFQFRNFPRVSYSFTNTSDIARLVLEVIFLICFYAKYLRDECKQMGERWEDPVKEDSPHWKAGDEKEQGIRKKAYHVERFSLDLCGFSGSRREVEGGFWWTRSRASGLSGMPCGDGFSRGRSKARRHSIVSTYGRWPLVVDLAAGS